MKRDPELVNIAVLGLWHLGCVTAACCAEFYRVVGVDSDSKVVERLNAGCAPILEPGLDSLVAKGIAAGRLSFSTDLESACRSADILWICYDTRVDEDDVSEVEELLGEVRRAIPNLREGALVWVSSQLPVGTCALLAREFPQFEFVCLPENLRLGRAIEVFLRADRVLVGLGNPLLKDRMVQLLSPISENLIFMRLESAEMAKHAINSFLAMSITFINEISRMCERFGADGVEVAAGLKSDMRIGAKAYLSPGGSFAGGTLARDVVTLNRLASAAGESLSLIGSIKKSNDFHRGWSLGRLRERLGGFGGKKVAVLGLTYKPGTDTLRRSAALELCGALKEEGCEVRSYDPAVKQSEAAEAGLTLETEVGAAVSGADALVICTQWPMFLELDWATLAGSMRRPLLIDANRFIERSVVGKVKDLEYLSVGRS